MAAVRLSTPAPSSSPADLLSVGASPSSSRLRPDSVASASSQQYSFTHDVVEEQVIAVDGLSNLEPVHAPDDDFRLTVGPTLILMLLQNVLLQVRMAQKLYFSGARS